MASDEYRPPWLPVNPVPEPAETSDQAPEAEPDPVSPAESEAPPAPEPAAEREDPPTPTAFEAAPAPEAAAAAPAFEAAPAAAPPTPTPPPSSTYAPFATPSETVPPTGSSPSPAAAAAFFGVRGDRAAAQREPAVAEPEPAIPEPASHTFEPPAPSATPEFVPPASALETPPSALETPAPEASPTPEPSVTRTSPYLSGSLPVTDHGAAPSEERAAPSEERATAQDSWAPDTAPSPPVTGSLPTVRPDDLTPTKPQMPHSAHVAPPEPEPTPEPATDSIPTPIEADEDEIIAPILPPPATEIMPRAGDDESERVNPPTQRTTAWGPTDSAEASSQREFSPAPTDSVRQLGASAISNASLQAAGAPTPMAGVPRVPEFEEMYPSFGDEEPFVPRFEPSASAPPPPNPTPTPGPGPGPGPGPTPTVSFAEPAPRTSSPLSEVDVPETDEPAYSPRVELSLRPTDEPGPTRVPPVRNTPVAEDPPTFASPSESAPAIPARPWSAVKDDDVEFASPTMHSGAGLPAEIAAERDADPREHALNSTDSPVSEPAGPPLPITPRRAVTDSPMGEGAPFDGSATDPDLASERDTVSASGEQDVTSTEPRKRKRWIWWLILGLLIASAAGFLVYRMFFLPEPVTLPVPTVTASPEVPVGEPMAIVDPTTFVASLPDTVQTNVLMGYESIDPLTESDLPARLAEHDKLSYGTGTGTPDFVVNAYQHYNVEDAQKAYDSWAAVATDVEPVLVEGEQVGERAVTEEGVTSTVVWRNVTAVFVLTGPAESVLDFYEHFGV